MTLKILGIVANMLLSYSSIPQIIKTIKTKKSVGISVVTSLSIIFGVVLMFLYLTLSYGFDWFIFVNNAISFVCWTVVFLYGVFKNK